MAADEIAKMALIEEKSTSTELNIEVQKCPSIKDVPTFTIQSTNNWMTPIVSFIQDGRLLQDAKEAKKIKKNAARFTILNDTFTREASPCVT